MHHHGKITAEFLGEIDRYAGVNAALTVEQLGVVSMRHDRAMPDARMDVGPGLAVAPEAIECLGRDIVAWERDRHNKALAVELVKHLAAVRVIIGTPC